MATSTTSCSATCSAMTKDDGVEWLGVIERQQQEIERLRQDMADATSSPPSPLCGLERCGSVASLAFSLLSMRDDGSELMDSECYAKICDKMEHMRAALAKKDAKLRKVRARCSEGQKENARLRHAVATMGSETEVQRARLAREHAATQSAVDKAVEKAAQALMKNDVLNAELRKLREVGAMLREDIRVRTNAMEAAERARDVMQKQLDETCREVSRLVKNVCALKCDKSSLQSELYGVQQELTVQRKNDSEWNELSMQRQMLQQRVRELEDIAKVQTSLVDQQNQQIQHLKGEQALAQQSFAVERAEDQRHVAHMLKINISLQHDLECELAQSRQLHEQIQAMSETSQMLIEDLLQTKLKVVGRDHVLQHHDQKYCELLTKHRLLARHTQAVELSERELVSVLVPTKKRLAILQDTLTRFCYELEGVTKQMVTSRNREVSLGRALREYGKRNRELQASVVAARQQFHTVVSAFRSSEKRKVQAISSNFDLKRDLVIERCQRTDLLRQCKELENCLASCQSSANETQTRAEGFERDNDVLQHAVTQLVAYAKELMCSQQALQRELTKLEITGRRQLAVYG